MLMALGTVRADRVPERRHPFSHTGAEARRQAQRALLGEAVKASEPHSGGPERAGGHGHEAPFACTGAVLPLRQRPARGAGLSTLDDSTGRDTIRRPGGRKPLGIVTGCLCGGSAPRQFPPPQCRIAMLQRPNILLILNDDMGFSDLGCYGGEIDTPHLDALARGGLRYSQFYNTARCCPSRGSLLTGLYPQQADIGHMMGSHGIDGYLGDLSPKAVTLAEVLQLGGYATYMTGKWHVTRHVEGPKHNWPCQRGFDEFFGIITGAANYWQPRTLTRDNERIEPEGADFFFTDAVSDEACAQIRRHCDGPGETPFFQYVAYTAPHWPLHAHPEDIAKYKGRFDAGWDALRVRRQRRMEAMGLLNANWDLSPRDPRVAPWPEEPCKEWQALRMEVYAAQIDRMDQGIGRILTTLQETGQLENTAIFFLADNGGCAEELGADLRQRVATGWEQIGTLYDRYGEAVRFGNSPHIDPGPENTYASYGVPWANLSNTPFRLYKHWVHEGGIATPLIVHWPAGIESQGELRHQPAQLPDIMATLSELGAVEYPAYFQGRSITPLEGFSLTPSFQDAPTARHTLYWEHEGNKAVRRGRWKLVCKFPGNWELYDLEADRTETRNLAAREPERACRLRRLFARWAERCGVVPWEDLSRDA